MIISCFEYLVDFVCACRCPDDGYWYRAQITDLPGEQMVNVCYVDYGNADKVSYLNLRKLLDEFLVLPVQVSILFKSQIRKYFVF